MFRLVRASLQEEAQLLFAIKLFKEAGEDLHLRVLPSEDVGVAHKIQACLRRVQGNTQKERRETWVQMQRSNS